MDSILTTFIDLGFNINNGESLEMIKQERERIMMHIENMKQDKTCNMPNFIRNVRLKLSYDAVIECFERMLGHQD